MSAFEEDSDESTLVRPIEGAAMQSVVLAMNSSLRVKHIVMWNVKSETPDERRRSIALVKNGFEALRGQIPGLIVIEIGIDHSQIDYACDVVLYTEFENQEALDAYAIHPAHLLLRDQLAGVRTSRHQVDYCPV